MQAIIGREFQITIPRKLRKKFHLKPGMTLLFDETATDLRMRPQHDFDIEAMRGALGAAKDFESGKNSAQSLRELRGYDRSEL